MMCCRDGIYPALGAMNPAPTMPVGCSLLADHVHAFGRRKAETGGFDPGVFPRRFERHARCVPEAVHHLDDAQLALRKTDADIVIPAVLVPGFQLHPREVALRIKRLNREIVVQPSLAGKQHRRGIVKAAAQVAHGGLLQTHVIHPEPLAIGHDLLLVRLFIVPAELVGTLDPQGTGGFLDGFERLVEHDLLEPGAETVHLAEKMTQAVRTRFEITGSPSWRSHKKNADK